MNWRHLQAFVWLRWRLLYNQWRRAGALNAVLLTVLTVLVVLTVVPLFFGAYAFGTYMVPQTQPVHLMYMWDGLVAGFVLFWCVGLVTELQRTDTLALSKFLHLPVSVNGAFLINYLSSLARLSLILFVPVMLGLACALVRVQGPLQLLTLPLLGGFLLMVTALTNQFQGWLASLMSNPRRRRTVVVTMTAGLVLVSQVPNLINLMAPWGPQRRADRSAALAKELTELTKDYEAKKFDATEHLRRQEAAMERSRASGRRADDESFKQIERVASALNVALPIGWLPLGVKASAEGNPVPAVLGALGTALIGSVSLMRAYRTTVREYQGQSTNRKAGKAPVAAPAATGPRKPSLVEARIPGLSEPVSAVALASFRSLLRAPEAKMMLLSPVIMVPIFGSMLVRSGFTFPEAMRPLVAIGAMVFVLFGVMQLMGNQFGFDRDGFRVYVLSPASRRDVLLGKNLAFAPLVAVLALALLALVQVFKPLRVDHLLAMFPQYVTMFLSFCLLTNLLSTLAPLRVAPGAFKSASPKLTTALLQVAMFLVVFPLTQGLTLLPVGAEIALRLIHIGNGLPVCLLLTLLQCAATVFIYRASLGRLGDLLQSREQAILETVTNRAP